MEQISLSKILLHLFSSPVVLFGSRWSNSREEARLNKTEFLYRSSFILVLQQMIVILALTSLNSQCFEIDIFRLWMPAPNDHAP